MRVDKFIVHHFFAFDYPYFLGDDMEIYIHIPYCRQKCRYCDFPSYACQEHTMAAYTDALLSEMDARLTLTEPADTVYIGGGTPSLLPPPLLHRLLERLKERCTLSDDAEMTSEANPGTLTREWLRAAVEGGVNRISMGMQSSQPELLRTLGRIHSQADVAESVRLVRQAGISNLNLDLMFGLPGQTPEMWLDTLHTALSLEPEHLSCYGLIPEDGTPLKEDLDKGRLTLPHEDDERRMYDDTLELLSRNGYQQYEISNFARPGYECRHNIGYWTSVPYVGLGASSASCLKEKDGMSRWSNPPDIPTYLHMVNENAWAMPERTVLTTEDERYETLMLGLRLTRGVSSQDFFIRHGITLDEYRGDTLRRLRSLGLLAFQDGFWRLTRRGMDVQNAVLVELMDD